VQHPVWVWGCSLPPQYRVIISLHTCICTWHVACRQASRAGRVQRWTSSGRRCRKCVKASRDYAAGGSICGPYKNVGTGFLGPLWRGWGCKGWGRARHAPRRGSRGTPTLCTPWAGLHRKMRVGRESRRLSSSAPQTYGEPTGPPPPELCQLAASGRTLRNVSQALLSLHTTSRGVVYWMPWNRSFLVLCLGRAFPAPFGPAWSCGDSWVLLTSANLSTAAWGSLQKQGSMLFIRSYEVCSRRGEDGLWCADPGEGDSQVSFRLPFARYVQRQFDCRPYSAPPK